MSSKLDQFWEQMINYAYAEQRRNNNIAVNPERKAQFVDTFQCKYSEMMTMYMNQKVQYLDRHKVSAILIYSVIRTGLLEYKDKTQVCKENYQLAISLALSYLVYESNIDRKEKGQKKLDRIIFPMVYNGNKDYKELLLSILEMSDIDDNINLLELANIMMLLERLND